MTGYAVRVVRPAQRQLDAVPRMEYPRLHSALKSLGDSPRPHGCVKLGDALFRVRCGSYRVIYSIADAEKLVLILKVARRSEKTYRDVRP